MNLFYKIENPFEDNQNLIKILDIYCNGRSDSGTKEIQNGDELYKRIIDYGQDKEDQTDYFNEFYKYTLLPNMNKLYKNITQIDFKTFDMQVENIKSSIEEGPLSDLEKKERINELYKKTMYPLSRFKMIFNSFNSFDEMEKIYNDQELWHIQSILNNIALYPSQKEKNIQELTKLGLTDEQIKNREILINFRNKMSNRFWRWRWNYGISCKSTKLAII